jgi:RimJ/RimL family protein N-acetyltransferase
MSVEVRLRDVCLTDLPVFYEQQCDLKANRMAAFAAREREAFMRHWTKILDDDSNILKTILWGQEVAGNVVSFMHDDQREIGYWLGPAYWRQGIASRALAQFLAQVPTRPLSAYVAQHNRASLRVLEKSGFKIVAEDAAFSQFDGAPIAGFVLRLA